MPHDFDPRTGQYQDVTPDPAGELRPFDEKANAVRDFNAETGKYETPEKPAAKKKAA